MVAELGLTSAVYEGSFAMQKLVDKDTKGPNISFGAIDVVNKALW
jgi:hypothetical protein